VPIRSAAKKPKPPFRAQWVKIPASWLTTLQQTRSGSTVRLALAILRARFEQYRDGEIVLSAAMTGMPQTTRNRAARELAGLGLIELEGGGHQAMRVVRVHV
jgi:hypothetical protein